MKNKVLMIVLALAGVICFAKTSKKNDDNCWVNYGNQWAQWGASWANGVPRANDGSFAGISTEDADSSMVSGVGLFENKEIKKELTVQGSGNFNKVKAHKKVTVYGAATAHDSTFKDVTVHGYLTATDSTFADVMLYTTKGDFDNCTIADLTVESKSKKPTIKLIDTTIKGDVVFKGKKGKLVLSGNSSIKGTVTNGQIIKK